MSAADSPGERWGSAYSIPLICGVARESLQYNINIIQSQQIYTDTWATVELSFVIL